MKVLVFDIETIPDTASARLLHDVEGLSEEEVVRVMQQLQYQKSNTEFMPLHLHRVVAISAVFEDTQAHTVSAASYGTTESSEAELVAAFFKTIEKYEPQLVTWNGLGFDLPVLNYRALFHNVQAPTYWERGDKKREYRYNNYQNRYHPQKNLDLMLYLSRFQRGASLDDIAKILKLPGKNEMHGDEVLTAWQENRVDEIRHYCESDTLNTYLIYLRFEFMCGNINMGEYEQRCENLENFLSASDKAHLQKFLQDWQQSKEK